MANVFSRYEISEKLSESAGTLVHRGRRIEDHQPVVLKILKLETASAEKLTRFRREFELLSRCNLPGVIKAYGLEQYHGSLLMALEDIGGEPVDRLLDRNPLNLELFLQLAIKSTDVLGSIHQKRIIHKDINPSHIIVNHEMGRLRLIGFGLADALPRHNVGMQPPAALEGTLAFMSPEQTGRMNRTVDYRTDFYSLGATFYRMLTGRQPFESNDAMGLVHCHLAKTAIAPHELNPAIPAAVSEIVMRLMAKMAEDRYQSAWGLKADLERCLDELAGGGGIPRFELGRGDLSDSLRMSQKLYGRERELEQLLAAFKRVSKGGRELLLLSGNAGVGKTALVHEIFQPITETSGFFIEGKFDELQRDVPFFGWIQAFRELARYLLMESEAELGVWKESILNAVGTGGKLLINVIPDLEFIIGPQPGVPEYPPDEARSRFRRVFRDFVKVFSTTEHPLVVFLDDLQWADGASALLIEALLDDPEFSYLLFVGAARNESVDALNLLSRLADKPESAGCRRTMIELRTLLPEDTRRMIAEMLQLPADLVQDLALLVHARTDGNPFFIKEFLLKLHEERLIYFDGAWSFDHDSIARADIPENIVHLIAKRIERLNDNARQVLKVAACIGANFTMPLLSELVGMSDDAVTGCLNAAVNEGFVLSLDHHFGFVHDRVREAVYSRIDPRARTMIHLAVGRALLRTSEKDRLDEPTFDVVHQLNLAADAITEPGERNELLLLNMRAGLKAKASTAYESAAGYLRRAASLLPDDKWDACQKDAITIFTELGETAYLSGNFEEAGAYLNEVLARAQAELDKVKVYELKMRMQISLNNMKEALQTGRDALRVFNAAMPRKASAFRVFFGMAQVRLRMGTKDASELLQLPEATDPCHLAVARLLMDCVEPAYIGEPDYYPIVIQRLLCHSLQHGNTKYSSYAYLLYGVILCTVLNDIEGGHRFGQLGMELMNRFRADELKSRSLFFFGVGLNHWKNHLRDDLDYLWNSYVCGKESGDAGFSSYALNHYHFHLFFMGTPLEKLRKDFAKYHDAARKTMQVSSIQAYELWYQLVCNLLGESADVNHLQGAFFNEDETVAEWKRITNFTTLGFHTVAKQLLYYLDNEYAKAVATAENGAVAMDGVRGMIFVPEYHAYYALSLLAAYSDAPEREKKNSLRKAKAIEKQFEKWAHHAPMNYQHKYALIKAERKRLDSRTGIEEIIGLYDYSIESAGRNGYLLDEAIANERAARFLTARGLQKLSTGYMRSAYELYERWGGKVKINRLKREFPGALSSRALEQEDRAVVSPHSSIELDFDTVMKASQAISGEIGLGRLMDRMMRIVIENAGAQKGFLVLEKDGAWVITAHCDINKGARIDIPEPVAIDRSDAISAGVIHFVAHTKEKVLLDDAAHEGAFVQDPHIKRQGTKSLLCAPLLSRGRLIAVVYLENNVATHAFTPARLRLLEILLAQAAPSLENARVYEALRESEAKFRAVAETSTAAILVYRPKIVYMNPAGIAFTGYSKDELFTMSIWDLAHPDFRENSKKRVLARMQGEEAGSRFEYKVITKDGKTGWVDFSATTFQYEGKIAVLGVAFDITERKEAEAQRAKLENQLRQAQKMEAIGTLAGGVAHDFNNILTTITGYGSLVKSRMGADNPLGGYMDDILSSAHRAANLTRSLLAFSRKQDISPRLENLNDTVKRVDKLLLHVIGEDIELITLLADEELNILADGNQIEQVLMNLAANARDAMPDGGILTLKTESVVVNGSVSSTVIPQGAYAVISISDTGTGMDDETRKRIFEPFFTTKEPGKGTGLGLSMVYGIIKQHEGEINVYSEPGKGTTFKIYLKLAGAGTASLSVVPSALPIGGTETILVAEDDFSVRKFVHRILEEYGYRVIEAVNGEDAVVKFMENKDRIELLILDVVMPKKNGKEAYEEIRRVRSEVPVIFSSGYTADIISKKGVLEEGINFISKPISSELLLVKIREVLSRK